MATTVIVYPSGTTSNTNPHVLFSGGTGATYTIEMTTTGELKFCQDIATVVNEVLTGITSTWISTLEYVDYDDRMYLQGQYIIGNTIIDEGISAFTSNNTLVATDYYSGLTVYRVDTVFDSSGSIMFITGDNDTSAGTPEVIRRVDLSTGQVTHEFVVGTGGHIHSRLINYEHNGTEYLAFSEISGSSSSTACITIMNPNNLSIIGRYGYTPTSNIIISYIDDLQYDSSNGKIYWTMSAGGYAYLNAGTVFGSLDLSTNTVSTGSTVPYFFYSQNQILDGTSKVYTAGFAYDGGQPSTAPITGMTYGYYDHSNNTYTELTSKTIDYSLGSNADIDVSVNGHSDKDKDTGDIYQLFLYDLLRVDSSSGAIVDTTDVRYEGDYYYSGHTSNYSGTRAIVTAMGYNESTNTVWTSRYNGDNRVTNIVIYGN